MLGILTVEMRLSFSYNVINYISVDVMFISVKSLFERSKNTSFFNLLNSNEINLLFCIFISLSALSLLFYTILLLSFKYKLTIFKFVNDISLSLFAPRYKWVSFGRVVNPFISIIKLLEKWISSKIFEKKTCYSNFIEIKFST